MAIGSYSVLKTVLSDLKGFQSAVDAELGYAVLDAEIRINWECNAKCKMCGLVDYIHRQPAEYLKTLEYEDHVKIVSALHSLNCRQITLSGGEPTLYGRLVDLVRCISSAKMNCAINTNGYLLTPDLLDSLIEAGVRIITFSLDSPVREQHDAIRGLPGSYDRIEQAIDYINAYNRNSTRKVIVLINCVLLHENIRSLGEFAKFYSKHPVHHINFSPASIDTRWDQWTTKNEELRATVEDVLYFKQKVIPTLLNASWSFQVSDPYGSTLEEIEKNIHSIYSDTPDRCYIPHLHVVIQSNGDVLPCCYADDGYQMGNITEQPFIDIWQGARYRAFRKRCIQGGRYEFCRTCREYLDINKCLCKEIRL